MEQEGALLILFEEDRQPPESIFVEQLTQDLIPLAEYADGFIYAYPQED